MKKQSCETCRFYKMHDSGTSGTCRHSPPTVVCLESGAHTFWPQPYPFEWCGQFKREKQEDK